MPKGHLFHLPEVTFSPRSLVAGAFDLQHVGMKSHWRRVLYPLALVGLFTWAVVAATLRWGDPATLSLRWIAALTFLLAFFADEILDQRASLRRGLCWFVQSMAALSLLWLAPREGVSPVLLVMLVATLARKLPSRRSVPLALAMDVAMFLIMRQRGHPAPLAVTALYAAFQTFAAMTMHYARNAEMARDRLSRVNADLLATRALLVDGSRDAERLRVARELHDVAGHKLTALRLNLRALVQDTAAPSQLQLAERLSAELLDDIRSVVHALRDVDGLDIATALHALAAPFPLPRLDLRIDDAVHVTDPALADTVLRLVQEALTNSARHAEARILRVSLSKQDATLHLCMEDDGRLRGALREGNGLTGMRERIREHGGRLAFGHGKRGALRIDAELPA